MASFDCQRWPKGWNWILTAGWLVWASGLASAQDRARDADQVADIQRVAPSTSVFAEDGVVLRWQVSPKEPAKGRLIWRMAIGHRTLASGELPIDGSSGGAADAEAAWKTPPLKPGAVQEMTLTASFVADGAREPEATRLETVWLFARDPFANRREWLKQQQLVLYDPAGETAECFANADIPFELVANLSAIESVPTKLIVVGEGVSFREDRGLPELLCQRVEQGTPVLCLAPTQGEFPLLDDDDPAESKMRSLLLGRVDRVRQLDKRLDPVQWMAGLSMTGSSMNGRARPTHTLFLGSGPSLVAEVREGDAGWSWLEVEFLPAERRKTPAKLVVACLPMIERWDDGPTPRYLLARLIEYLINPDSNEGA